VGRPTKWGNPYPLGPDRTAVQAVEEYRRWLALHPELERKARQVLAGHDLVCWCQPGAACHADVLLEVANARVGG